ncbi:hypothetical protein [Clostridium minihomine]|uniref:hypothetical protein n=1 Tax=Clostridium minihomine TaxID=2045012 RepID=UPI000C77C141|nr:hypothetical protein [Clostridium minihomine]
MGKFDDFDLDFTKVSAAAENSSERAGIAVPKLAINWSKISCACSPSDMTVCRAGAPGQLRC